MNTFLIITLVISQIITFFLIFKKIKPIKIKKPDGIILKPIKDPKTYPDMDKEYDLVYEVLESIKIESWEVEVEETFSISRDKNYTVQFKSPNGKTRIRSRVRYDYDDNEAELPSFYINGNGGSISLNSDNPIKNDILLFLWDYIIEFNDNHNKGIEEGILKSIKGIRDNLKTLRRSDRLNDILS